MYGEIPDGRAEKETDKKIINVSKCLFGFLSENNADTFCFWREDLAEFPFD